MNIKEFEKLPVMGILRGIEEKSVIPLAEAMISSGLKTVEITMNTHSAADLIKVMIKAARGRLTVGAGTVLTMNDLYAAQDAGAAFIVLPVFCNNIVEYCVRNKIPVFPGALTPKEIHDAWSAGVTMVKVFPAKFFGPAYFKEIKGPFDDIKLLACGGITKDNIGEFFSCGASAVAFGGSIFKKEWIKEKKFSYIEESIKAVISAFRVSVNSEI